ncbi:MAG TPA: THUMP domain-containing protein [Bacteroidales bacterium]|nr:THUMP domain-containing protein [Bacteroidales bacterium]
MNNFSENETLSQQTFVAKTIAGLEDVLAGELISLGAQNVQKLHRAVSFEGDKKLMYRANYSLRTALRILVPLYSFQLADEDDLYQNIYDYSWENHLKVTNTLAVDAVVTDSELTHSHFVALRTKDAVCDRFRAQNNGRRPSVDTDNPDFRISVHINGNQCDVLADSSGASLHKRGYRVSNAEAPMSEVLAAGLILLTGWDKKSNFIDPMCGSGTLLIEAALIANNFPPGMYRKEFGFERWNDFDAVLWETVKQEALDEQNEFEYKILGSDISGKNLSAAHANVKSARLHKDIQLSVSAFADVHPPQNEPGIIVMNPPYGERIRTNDIIGLYRTIGDTLKQSFAGYTAWIISSDQMAIKFIGLKPARKFEVWNGPLECKFEKFELYRGSKKFEGEVGEDHISRPPRRKDFQEVPERRERPDREGFDKWPDRREDWKEKRSYSKDRPEREKPTERRSYPDRNREDKPWKRDEKRDGKPPYKSRDENRTSDKPRPWNDDKRKPARPYSDKPKRDNRTDDESSRERRFSDKRPYETDETGRRIYPNKKDERKKLYSDRPTDRPADRQDRNDKPRYKDKEERPRRHYETKEHREIEQWTPREQPEPKQRVERSDRPKKEEKFEPSQKPKRPRSTKLAKPPKPQEKPGSKGKSADDKWEEMGD